MQECFQDIGLLCDDLQGVAFHLKRGDKFDVDVHNAHNLTQTRTFLVFGRILQRREVPCVT